MNVSIDDMSERECLTKAEPKLREKNVHFPLTETERCFTFRALVILKRQTDLGANVVDRLLAIRCNDMCANTNNTLHALVMHTKSAIVANVGCLHHAPDDARAMIAVQPNRWHAFLEIHDKMMAKDNLRFERTKG